jgi:hypothetical protein
MSDYEIRPDQSTDDLIARARRFGSTQEFREFRAANSERRAEMMRWDRDNNNRTESDEDGDRRRELEFLKIYEDFQ